MRLPRWLVVSLLSASVSTPILTGMALLPELKKEWVVHRLMKAVRATDLREIEELASAVRSNGAKGDAISILRQEDKQYDDLPMTDRKRFAVHVALFELGAFRKARSIVQEDGTKGTVRAVGLGKAASP
jgi:hypothetical protein